MWLPIVITCLALAMIVGPVMLMQPSLAQKRTAARRLKAAQIGLRVHLQSVPAGVELKSGAKQMAMYCLPWKDSKDKRDDWFLVKKKFSHELHFDGFWDWQKPSSSTVVAEALRAALAQIPEAVVALTAGPQGVCCYWAEHGDDAQVEALSLWLQAIRERLE